MKNIDKLFQSVADRGHVCVGLDTDQSHVPNNGDILDYNKELVDTTIDVAACYKVQIACYEALGLTGLKIYSETLKHIRSKGGLVIADIKRGDIGNTAEYYAKGHYDGDFEADFVTLAPYMGMDSIEPWAKIASQKDKGAFVLMHTSNKGRDDFQYIKSEDGKLVYEKVGDKLSALAEQYMGANGYGMFGAVAGCTDSKNAEEIRALYPNLFFLIPGYGAQGGTAEDCAKLMVNGNGGVVNASRSILTAWKKQAEKEGLAEKDITSVFATEAARTEVYRMRDAIREACAVR